jgi:hypothetical protein
VTAHRVLRVFAALLLLGGIAHAGEPTPPAGTLQDGEHAFQIVVTPGWQPVPAPDGTLAGYREASGAAVLAITRVELGRAGESNRPRMVDEVERGVERATPGYRRLRRTLTTDGIVPVLDLAYRRQAGETLSRFLFFRRHTVVLSIGLEPGAPRAVRKAAEAMVKSFRPFVR